MEHEELYEKLHGSIELCRREVDRDIHTLRMTLEERRITEEQMEDIATRAAQKAKALTKQALIDDAKMEIANGAISILRNAVRIIALCIVGLAFYLGNFKWPWNH